MEQQTRQLSKGSWIQIGATLLILISIFLPWAGIDRNASVSLINMGGAAGDIGMVDGRFLIIHYVVLALIVLSLVNVVYVFLKEKKLFSVLLTILTILVLLFFVLIAANTSFEVLSAGFYLALIGVIALIVGMSKNKKNKKNVTIETANEETNA